MSTSGAGKAGVLQGTLDQEKKAWGRTATTIHTLLNERP
jgi:hypothetical protein